MSIGTLPMAKARNEVSVKINADVYRLVKTVAAWRGISVADYLSEIVYPIARKDMEKVNRESDRMKVAPPDNE